MKYIDSEKLIELVKEWRSKQMGFAWDAVNEVLKIITSLQQEQPEVDLEIEFRRRIDKLDDKYCVSIKDYSMQDMKDTARHFYELGLNARKEG